MTSAHNLIAAVVASPECPGTRAACRDWFIEFGTEDDWQTYLDEFPDHHLARECFADWLEERDDPRAAGMRALGVNQLRPYILLHYAQFYRTDRVGKNSPILDPASDLPDDWYDQMSTNRNYREFTSRRRAEDAAALAFARLPEHRRAELLRAAPAPVAG